MTDRDLVLVTLPGVQRFIAESRSTADVAAGSLLMSELARAMLSVAGPAVDVVLPMAGEAALPNRVVVRAAPGTGAELARLMASAAEDAWSARVTALWRGGAAPQIANPPGFPDAQWIVVDASAGSYAAQWTLAQRALAARKRTRSFSRYDERSLRQICGLTGRWAAVDESVPTRRRVRRRRGEALSVPALVKRTHDGARFPSTWSVASGPFRHDLIKAALSDVGLRDLIGDLRRAIDVVRTLGVEFGSGALPGLRDIDGIAERDELRWLADVEGACLIPETWDAESLAREHNLGQAPQAGMVEGCASALGALRAAVDDRGLSMPTSYLAVVVQDADRMGRRLSRLPDGRADLLSWHQEVSTALVRAAGTQETTLEQGHHLGRLVYAGGDDVLGFAPVRHAIAASGALNTAFTSTLAGTSARPGVLKGATASTALVFFHASSPLQSVLAVARELLDEVKAVHRPGFGAAVLRRGGERVRAIRPYLVGPPLPAGWSAPQALTRVVDAMRGGLSGRLVTDLERLERDTEHVGQLSVDGRKRELRRLALRHGATWDTAVEAVDALLSLSAAESLSRNDATPTSAARWAAVARFITSEAWS